VDAQTLFDIGSITKSFTATAILQLMEQQKLRPEDPLSRFFPEAPADKKDITLHQLLTHSSGLPDAVGFDYDAVSTSDFLQKTWSAPLAFAPGKGYQYSNVGYSLLGMIVEQQSGLSYDVFLQKNIFTPAGMKTAGYSNPAASCSNAAHGYLKNGEDWGRPCDKKWDGTSPFWHLKANGGLLMSANDMLHWYRALRERKVLSTASLSLQTQPHTDEGGGHSFYGYGLVVTDEGQCIQHNGGNGIFRADFKWFPGLDVVLFVATSDAAVPLFKISEQLKQILLTGEMPEVVEWQEVPLQTFPADARQKAASAMLACIHTYSETAADAFTSQYCSESMLQRNNPARLREILQMFSRDAGGNPPERVAVSGDRMLLVVPAGKEVRLKVTLAFDGDKVDRLSAELSD
jgi:CubicO group peptidase (beta-lactamase class C family)